MKAIIKAFTLLTLCTPLLLSSCKKETESTQPETQNMSQQEAEAVAEIVAVAAIEETESYAETAPAYAPQDPSQSSDFCGETFDTTLAFSYQYQNLSVAFESTWAITVNCNNLNVPESLSGYAAGAGNAESTLMTSTLTNNTIATLDGLLPNQDSYVFNGTYDGAGTLQSKVGLKRSYAVVASVNLEDIEVDKDTLTATGGTATMVIEATSSTGNTAVFNATVTINGDGTATVEINGNSFTIYL